jgi:hypothetical protein
LNGQQLENYFRKVVDKGKSTVLLFLVDVLLDNSLTSSNFFESSSNLFSNDVNLSGCELAVTTADGVTAVI